MDNGNLFISLWLICNCVIFKNSLSSDVPEWLHTFTSCPSSWPTFQIFHDPESDPNNCHQQCQEKCEGRALFLDNDVNQLYCYHQKTAAHLMYGTVNNVATCSCGGKYERYETFLDLRKKITGEFEKCVPEIAVSLDHLDDKFRVAHCKSICDSTNVYWMDGQAGGAPRIVICQTGHAKTTPLRGKCNLTAPVADGLFSCSCGVKPKNLIPNSSPQIERQIATKNKQIDGYRICGYPYNVQVMFAFKDVGQCDEFCSHHHCKGKAFYDDKNELVCYTEKVKTFSRIIKDGKLFTCECGVYNNAHGVSARGKFEQCDESQFSWPMEIANPEECDGKCLAVKALIYTYMGTQYLLRCVDNSKRYSEVSIRGKCKNKIYSDELIGVTYRECHCGIPLANTEKTTRSRNIDDDVRVAASLLVDIKCASPPIITNRSHQAIIAVPPKSKNILRNKRHPAKLRSISDVMESTSQTSAPEVNLHPSRTSARPKSRLNRAESSFRNNPVPSVSHQNSSRGKRIAQPRSDSERTGSERAISASMSGAESSTDSSRKPPKDSDTSADSVEKNKIIKKRRNKENLTGVPSSNSSFLDMAGTSKCQTGIPNSHLLPSTSKHPPRRTRSNVPLKPPSFEIPLKYQTKPSASKQPISEIPSLSIESASDIAPKRNRKQKPPTSENLSTLSPPTFEIPTSSKAPTTRVIVPQTLTAPKHKRKPLLSEITSTSGTSSSKHVTLPQLLTSPKHKRKPRTSKIPSKSSTPDIAISPNPTTLETSPTPDPPHSEIPPTFKLFASEICATSKPPTVVTPSVTKPPLSETSSPKLPTASTRKSRTPSLEVPTTSDHSQKSVTSPVTSSASRRLPTNSIPKKSFSESEKHVCGIPHASNQSDVSEKQFSPKAGSRKSSPKLCKNHAEKTSAEKRIEIGPTVTDNRRGSLQPSSSCPNKSKFVLDVESARNKSGTPESAHVDDLENPQPKRNKKLHDSESSNPARVERLPTDGEPLSISHEKQSSDAIVSTKNSQKVSRQSSTGNSSSKSGTQRSNRSKKNANKTNSTSSHSKRESSSSYDSDNWLTL